MITISLVLGTVRVEAARVVLPGYEWVEVYATPYWLPKRQEPSEAYWTITDAKTGRTVMPRTGQTIEEAVELAVEFLRARKIGRAEYEAAQRLAGPVIDS